MGFVSELGKVLYLFDETTWNVEGETFPVGCQFYDAARFESNPDLDNPILSNRFGIYRKHCGLRNVHLSWGQDEYLYQVLERSNSLPKDLRLLLRYRSQALSFALRCPAALSRQYCVSQRSSTPRWQ